MAILDPDSSFLNPQQVVKPPSMDKRDPVGVAGKRVAFEMGYAAVHTAWEPSYRYVGSKGVAGANNIQSPGFPFKTS